MLPPPSTHIHSTPITPINTNTTVICCGCVAATIQLLLPLLLLLPMLQLHTAATWDPLCQDSLKPQAKVGLRGYFTWK